MADFIPCEIKQLHPDLNVSAAQVATDINQANAPPPGALAMLGVPSTPQRIAVMTSKYWGNGGVNLTVGFLETAPLALAQKILAHMNAWGSRCNVVFTLVQTGGSRAKVRITLKGHGYWSYLGTDLLSIPLGQPTMCFQDFSLNTPDSEFFRVVRHEAAHSLSCPHEHQRKEIVDRIDPAKAIAYYSRTQGWSAEEVRQQVLTPLEESSLMGTAHADQASIMAYSMSGDLTRDGLPIVGGSDIDESDYAFMASVYPKVQFPPVPPPPVNPPVESGWTIKTQGPVTITGTGSRPTIS